MQTRLILLATIMFTVQFVVAQQKPTELDKSPMDVVYYPPNYPVAKMSGKINGTPVARILYSRPQKKDRNIFGGEVKFNEVWRIGANETTEIEFFKPVIMGGKKVAKGRYSMFCIPTQNKWTFILNKDNFTWGSYTYKEANDVVRFDVPVQKSNETTEALTMYFDSSGTPKLVVMWDDIMVSVPISM